MVTAFLFALFFQCACPPPLYPLTQFTYVGDSQTVGGLIQPRVSNCLAGNCANTTTAYQVTTYAVSAITLAGMGTSYDALVAARFGTSGGLSQTVVLWGGTNDLGEGASGATTYTRLQARVTAYRAAGFTRIVALTCLPRTAPGDSAGYEAERITFNSSVRSGAGASTWTVADIGGNATLGDQGDQDNTTYFSDGTHITAAAADIIAPIVATAVASLP